MKYNIISINDDRIMYKEAIRSNVHREEVNIPAVNAFDVNIQDELSRRGIKIAYPGMFSVGEIGIWLSMFDCWQWAVDNNEELITFEDDAIPYWDFQPKFDIIYEEIPKSYDFFCLWVPDNQRIDYVYNVVYDDEGIPRKVGPNRHPSNSIYDFGPERVTRVYNGYGNVAQLFSPKGAKFFMDRVRDVGIYTPVDCYLYQEAHAGRCEGYGPKPNYAKLVSYDWKAETTVHRGERV